MPTAKPETLERIANIIKDELPKRLSPEFRINDVIAENWAGPEAEDFVHVRVVLEDDHPKLDAQKRINFRRKMRDHFYEVGIDPAPVISFAIRSELIR